MDRVILATTYGKRCLLELNKDTKADIFSSLKKFKEMQNENPKNLLNVPKTPILSLEINEYTATLTVQKDIIILHAIEKTKSA